MAVPAAFSRPRARPPASRATARASAQAHTRLIYGGASYGGASRGSLAQNSFSARAPISGCPLPPGPTDEEDALFPPPSPDHNARPAKAAVEISPMGVESRNPPSGDPPGTGGYGLAKNRRFLEPFLALKIRCLLLTSPKASAYTYFLRPVAKVACHKLRNGTLTVE